MHIFQTRKQNIETETADTENVRDLALIETMKQAIQDIYDKYPNGLETVSVNRNDPDDSS